MMRKPRKKRSRIPSRSYSGTVLPKRGCFSNERAISNTLASKNAAKRGDQRDRWAQISSRSAMALGDQTPCATAGLVVPRIPVGAPCRHRADASLHQLHPHVQFFHDVVEGGCF